MRLSLFGSSDTPDIASAPFTKQVGSDSGDSRFRSLRSLICDSIMAALVVLGLPALVASYFKSVDFSAMWPVALQAASLITASLILVFRGRLSFEFRALSLLAAMYLLGLVGWFAYGIMGGAKLFHLVLIILSGLLFGYRMALFAMLLVLITIGCISYLFSSGIVIVDVDLVTFHQSPSAWITLTFTLALFGGFISVGVAALLRNQERVLDLLAARSTYLNTVIDQSQAGFLTLDDQLRVQSFNERAASWLDKPEDLVAGAYLSNLFDSGVSFRRLMSAMNSALQGQTVSNLEIQHFTNGAPKDLIWNIGALSGDNGSTVGLVCFAQEVTELRRSQRKLDHSIRLTAMGEMTSSIAHEINQPLNVIRLGVAGVKRMVDRAIGNEVSIDPYTIAERLERIDSHIERAATITDHMRLFGADHQGSKEEFELHEVLSKVVAMKETIYKWRDIELNYDPKDSRVMVIARKSELEQALLIVLSNAESAVKSLEPGAPKTIAISVESEVSHVAVAITDTGDGIAASDLPRVFEPFFTTSEPGAGTGLGLPLARQLMEEMGGSIELTNSKAGGACATLRLQSMVNSSAND